MITLDISAFLTQNTAFYAGFLLGFLCGAFLAYIFFKNSLRYFKDIIKSLREELKRDQEKHTYIQQEFTKSLSLFLSQGKNKDNQTDHQTTYKTTKQTFKN